MMFDVYEKIRTWADERGILKNGTLKGQSLKLIEEFGELAAGIARGDREAIKDAIGDCLVVLTIMDAMESQPVYSGDDDNCEYSEPLAIAANCMAAVIDGACNDLPPEFVFDQAAKMQKSLCDIAEEYELTGLQCAVHAWDQIKDRRGHMNEQGVFVKEDA